MDPIAPNCPVCGQPMSVRRLECPHCAVSVEGRFRSAFSGLAPDLLDFAERFVRSRGNLKEMERETSLSYPALRARLDEVVQALGGEGSEPRGPSLAEGVLERLRAGEISAQDAVGLLRKGDGPARSGQEHEEDES